MGPLGNKTQQSYGRHSGNKWGNVSDNGINVNAYSPDIGVTVIVRKTWTVTPPVQGGGEDGMRYFL